MKQSTQTTRLLELLELTHPLIQAPMAGVSNPALAAAVAATGALGSLGMGASSAIGLEKTLTRLAALTNRAVNRNFFTHRTPARDDQRESAWLERMRPLFAGIDAHPPEALDNPYAAFDEDPQLLDILLAQKAPVISFHFGLPKPAAVSALKSQGSKILSTATSVKEAQWLESHGVDVVIAQGWEAGGHRGQFLDDARQDEQLGLSSLLPQICAAVDVPVIAAGGINTGAAVKAAMLLGAAGAQLGTAFVTCPESSTPAPYRAALTQSRDTIMTPVFSGRNARGLTNRFTDSLAAAGNEAPDYPVAYDAGKALVAAANATGEEDTAQDFAAMWAGQSYRGNRVMPAAELVALIVSEMQAV